MTEPDLHRLRADVTHLAASPRPSASPQERAAAEWVVSRFEEEGATARVDLEPGTGGYWWPLGIPCAVGAAAAVLGTTKRGRLAAVALGAVAGWSVWDDIRGGRRFLRDRLLPQKQTANAVGHTGDASARRAVVVVSHLDSAHTGALFSPVSRELEQRFPALVRKAETSLPVMVPIVLGPVLAAAGAAVQRRWLSGSGFVLCVGSIAVLANIGLSPAVPGANDNATGVAVDIALARAFAREPVEGVRVVLLATGGEEAFTEGMRGWVRRYREEFRPEDTDVICVDCTGGPELIQLEGEGMLIPTMYPEDFKGLVQRVARDLGMPPLRELLTRSVTDGLTAARAGYPTVMITTVNGLDEIPHYHWPTDTPENVSFDTVAQSVRLVEALVRRIAAGDL